MWWVGCLVNHPPIGRRTHTLYEWHKSFYKFRIGIEFRRNKSNECWKWLLTHTHWYIAYDWTRLTLHHGKGKSHPLTPALPLLLDETITFTAKSKGRSGEYKMVSQKKKRKRKSIKVRQYYTPTLLRILYSYPSPHIITSQNNLWPVQLGRNCLKFLLSFTTFLSPSPLNLGSLSPVSNNSLPPPPYRQDCHPEHFFVQHHNKYGS